MNDGLELALKPDELRPDEVGVCFHALDVQLEELAEDGHQVSPQAFDVRGVLVGGLAPRHAECLGHRSSGLHHSGQLL